MSFSSKFQDIAKMFYTASKVMAAPLMCVGGGGYIYASSVLRTTHKAEIAELEAKHIEQEAKHKVKVGELEAKYTAAMDELQKKQTKS